MEYAFQLLPHANVRYSSSLAKIGNAELRCMLRALGRDVLPVMKDIGGMPFFVFQCEPLGEQELDFLSALSSTCLWTRREGEALYPLTRRGKYLPGDMSEVLKYKGKTNASFTALMLNVARSQSAFALEKRPLTVVDPMCCKGTTLFCALEQGMHAVGMDRDHKDLKEAVDFVSRSCKFQGLKHKVETSSRSLPKGQPVPQTRFTLADTREHYQGGDTRTLTFLEGDTRSIGTLMRKTPAELLVADLPYGIQHAPEGNGRAEKFDQLLRQALPLWYTAIKPGGAMALSFNAHTLQKKHLALWAKEAGWIPILDAPLDDMEHFVEQAVNRDVLICLHP